MTFDLIVQGGTLVTGSGRTRCDIAISGGKVAALLAPGAPAQAARRYDAAGLHILPGVIDAHVHLREPGLTHKEDLATGTRAALYGGVTTVADMPNVVPPTATAALLRERIALAAQKAVVGVRFFGLLTGQNLDELGPMREAGALGYKVYLGSTTGNNAAPPAGVLLEQLARAKSLGMRVAIHAEDDEINGFYTARMQAAGRTDAACLPLARPAVSEVATVARALCLARAAGAAVHICHVSSAGTVELVRRAKADGMDVTAETCPHYLLLTSSDYERLGPRLKAYPTIKGEEDRAALWQGIADGTIDLIATDHAPHTTEEKSGDIWHAAAGLSGVEVSVRLMLDQVHRGALTLERYVQLASEGPARVWGLYPHKGCVQVGSDADLTVVDLGRTGTIRAEALHGRGRITAFEGVTTVGLPVATVVAGQLTPLV